MNSELGLELTKENTKSHLKLWKRYYAVVTDAIKTQSGFKWDEEWKMIVVTAKDVNEWKVYVKVQNKQSFILCCCLVYMMN